MPLKENRPREWVGSVGFELDSDIAPKHSFKLLKLIYVTVTYHYKKWSLGCFVGYFAIVFWVLRLGVFCAIV